MATREEIDRAAAGPVVDHGPGARGSVTGAGYVRTGTETPGAQRDEEDEFTTPTGVAIPEGHGERLPLQGSEVAGGGMRMPESARGVAVEPTQAPGMGRNPSDQTVSGTAPSTWDDSRGRS